MYAKLSFTTYKLYPWYSQGDPSVLMHLSGGGGICAPQIGIAR